MSPEAKRMMIGVLIAAVFVLIMWAAGAVEGMSGRFDPFYSRIMGPRNRISADGLGREARGRLCGDDTPLDQFMFNGKMIGCDKCPSPGWCPECLDSDYDLAPRERMGAVSSQMKSRTRAAMITALDESGPGDMAGSTGVSCPRSGILDARLAPEIRGGGAGPQGFGGVSADKRAAENPYGALYSAMGFDVDPEGAVVSMESHVGRLPADPPVFRGQNGYLYREM